MPEGALSRRAAMQCDQCGQVDDHPNVHVNDSGNPDDVATKHHGCLSVREKDLLVGSAQQPGSVNASSVNRRCEGGLHSQGQPPRCAPTPPPVPSDGGSYPTGGVSLAGALATAAASKSEANTAAVTGVLATTRADNQVVDSTGTRSGPFSAGGTSIGKPSTPATPAPSPSAASSAPRLDGRWGPCP